MCVGGWWCVCMCMYVFMVENKPKPSGKEPVWWLIISSNTFFGHSIFRLCQSPNRWTVYLKWDFETSDQGEWLDDVDSSVLTNKYWEGVCREGWGLHNRIWNIALGKVDLNWTIERTRRHTMESKMLFPAALETLWRSSSLRSSADVVCISVC